MIWRERNLNTMTGRTDVDHIPALPGWLGIIRVVQLVLAIIIVGLVGFAASRFSGVWDGSAMTFFTFAWTIIYFIYLGVATLVMPTIYNIWAHLGLEALTTLWWLVSWALLASEASAFDSVYYGYGYYHSYGKAAVSATKAGAALGAIEWVLFVITAVFLVLAWHRSRATEPVATTSAAPMEQHNMQPVV